MCPSGKSLAAAQASTRHEFRSAFDALDSDRDGKISSDDLRRFYLSSGASCDHGYEGDDDDVIGTMMSVADFNNDGFVEYDEFERVLGGGKKNKKSGVNRSNGVMEDVFMVMDKDGDGKLSHQDLKIYMQWAGFNAIRIFVELVA